MKKWIAIALLAGLAACSSNTTTDKAEPAEATPPAAQPAPEPPPVLVKRLAPDFGRARGRRNEGSA